MRFNVTECRRYAVKLRQKSKKENKRKKTGRRKTAWSGWKGLNGPEKAPAKLVCLTEVISPDPQVSVRRQCEVLKVCRGSYYYRCCP
jgi:hypothetical protein